MPHDTTLLHVADESVFLERLHCLPNNKAPGPDGMPNEILKHLRGVPNDLKECIHKLLIIMYATHKSHPRRGNKAQLCIWQSPAAPSI